MMGRHPILLKRAKKELEELIHNKASPHHHHHHKETHGISDDINGSTLISKLKGQNAFKRTKEEVKAQCYRL